MHVCALPVSLGPIPPGPPRSQALLPGGEEQSLRRLAATRIIKHRHWLHFWRRRFIIYRNTGTHADWLRGRKGRLNGRQPRNPKSSLRPSRVVGGVPLPPPPASSSARLYYILFWWERGRGGGAGRGEEFGEEEGKGRETAFGEEGEREGWQAKERKGNRRRSEGD